MGHEWNETALERIGPYAVLAPIAVGPRSRVVLARVVTGPDAALVAIKQPVFAAEAALLSTVDHPNIIRALSIIDEPGIPPAVAMEYGNGGTLADRLDAGQLLTADDVATTLAPIADALAMLHDAGIVHQDVKTENIVFVGSRAALIDFGSATSAGMAATGDADVVLATIDYLDPDVADGAAPSPRSDQYAFAATCYAALTGRPPHRSPTPLATLRSADLADHVRLDPDEHGPLADVIERALSRRPSDRFNDLRTLAAALRTPVGSAPLDRIAVPVPCDRGHDETWLGADRVATAELGSVATARTTTRIFRTRRVELDAARAVRGPRVSRRVAAVATAVVFTGGLVGWATMRTPRDVPVAAVQPRAQRPACDPRTEAQCVKDWERSSSGMTVHFVNEDRTVRYEVGRVSDGMRVANYFCGGTETLALYRPETGVVYYWTAWPEDGSDDRDRNAVVTFADRTGIVGARPSTADIDGDGCADLALDGADGRTWFSPHGQPRRLARVDSLPVGDGA